MPTTTVPSALRADKSLARQIVAFDESLENAEDFIELMTSSGAQAPMRKEVASLRQHMKSVLEAKDAQREAARGVAALVQAAAKLVDRASAAMAREIHDRYLSLWTRARGLLAQALVEVGDIEPAPLRLPVQKEQAELRTRLDRIEKDSVKGLNSVTELQDLLPQIEVLLKRLAGVAAASRWVRANYMPQMARVRAAIQRVPTQRCRKTLLAELDFIEADTHQALGRADTKAVQTRALPRLQLIETLAAQVAAAAPSLDRELARLAKRLAGDTGAPPALTQRLKAMIQARATTWPAGPDADCIAASVVAFESELGRLAADVDRRDRLPARA